MGLPRKLWVRLLLAGAWIYFTAIFGWLGLYLLSGDRWLPVSLLTSAAPVAFYPLPGVILLAAFTRRRSLWVGGGATVIVWLVLFGSLFDPRPPMVQAAGPTLRAMTFNVQYYNSGADAVADTIRAANVDVVALQEYRSRLSQHVGASLADEYPYQHIQSGRRNDDMGFLSRYPFEEVTPPGRWYGYWEGRPRAFRVKTASGPVLILNVHFPQGHARDATAALIASWVEVQTEPVIVLGDLNATDLSDAYETLRESGLSDAWREAGWGYGATFPARSGFTFRGRVPVFLPGRLVRIDHVLYSSHFHALSAERLGWDGNSDHLPVVAELAWAD